MIEYNITVGNDKDTASIAQFQVDMAMESEGTALDHELVLKGVAAAMADAGCNAGTNPGKNHQSALLFAGSIGRNMLSGEIPFHRSENLGNRGRDRMRSCAAWHPAQPQYGYGASKEAFGGTLDPNRPS